LRLSAFAEGFGGPAVALAEAGQPEGCGCRESIDRLTRHSA
jgi:hypothetical protein